MDFSSSIAVLFDGLVYGWPAFEERVGRILKVGRVNTMRSDPTMRGRILGISCNKFEKFIADTGTFVAIIPRSVVEKNKLQLGPVDPDEPDYGHPWRSYLGLLLRRISYNWALLIRMNQTMKV